MLKLSAKFSLFGLLLLSGCGTSTGTYAVGLSFEPFSSRLFADVLELDSRALGGVTGLTMCFKRLRFKADKDETTTDTATDKNNIDFALGEVVLGENGTTLGEVQLAPGTYRRIEFDLENDCASGKSLIVTNGNGTFSTTNPVTLKFKGEFTLEDADTTLALALSQIYTGLANVTNNSGVKNEAEAADGAF